MFTVRRHRQFICGGYAYTIWCECAGPQLNDVNQLAGVDFNEFWQWLANNVADGIMANDGTLLVAEVGTVQTVGENLSANPDAVTPETLAAFLTQTWRSMSTMVQAVTVLRSALSSFADNSVECTVRVNECTPMTQAEFVDALRNFANMNRLILNRADTGG